MLLQYVVRSTAPNALDCSLRCRRRTYCHSAKSGDVEHDFPDAKLISPFGYTWDANAAPLH